MRGDAAAKRGETPGAGAGAAGEYEAGYGLAAADAPPAAAYRGDTPRGVAPGKGAVTEDDGGTDDRKGEVSDCGPAAALLTTTVGPLSPPPPRAVSFPTASPMLRRPTSEVRFCGERRK